MTTDTAASTTAATDSTDTAITTSATDTAPATGEGQGESETATEAATAAEAADSVPDAYTFALPEGLTLEGERAEQTTALFKEIGLSQDNAQKLVDFFVSMRPQDEAAIDAALGERMDAKRNAQIDEWGQQTKAKYGEQFEAVNSDVRVAYNAYKTPELEEAMETEGWGNHPALVGFFASVGKLIRSSGVKGMGGDTARADDVSLADRMYPDMKR